VIVTTSGLDATPPVLRPIEASLLDAVGGGELLWCGRGATALYWAYRAVAAAKPAPEPAEVILPTMACTTPADAALLAGLRPRFADADPATGLVALPAIAARWTPQTRAVVFVHLYGQTAALGPLREWCHARGVALIEDAAQALGARLPDGSPVGSVGDLCIYSFTRTKILESGGGALLARASAYREALAAALRGPAPPLQLEDDDLALLALSQRNLHHALVALRRLRAIPAPAPLLSALRASYDRLYLRGMRDPAALAAAWGGLPAALAQRRRAAEEYAERLQGGPWRILDGWRASGVCWRFSLLLDSPEPLVAFSDALRQDGFHVSNLYWPVHEFFAPDDDCPAAEAFARRIVNLWVDPGVSLDWVRRCADSARRHARRLLGSGAPAAGRAS